MEEGKKHFGEAALVRLTKLRQTACTFLYLYTLINSFKLKYKTMALSYM